MPAEPIPALLTKTLILTHYLPTSERTLDRWVSAGQFPRPDIAMGGKARFWKRETVERWIDENAAGPGRHGGEAKRMAPSYPASGADTTEIGGER